MFEGNNKVRLLWLSGRWCLINGVWINSEGRSRHRAATGPQRPCHNGCDPRRHRGEVRECCCWQPALPPCPPSLSPRCYSKRTKSDCSHMESVTLHTSVQLPHLCTIPKNRFSHVHSMRIFHKNEFIFFCPPPAGGWKYNWKGMLISLQDHTCSHFRAEFILNHVFIAFIASFHRKEKQWKRWEKRWV